MPTTDRIRRAVRHRTDEATRLLRAAAERRRRRALVLGDSHAAVFYDPSWRDVPIRFAVHNVRAATLTGLANRESASGARRRFDSALTSAAGASPAMEAAVLLFGEVDCGYILWIRHERDGTPLDELLDRAVVNYRGFVEQVAGVTRPVVLSAPLPTLTYQSMIGDYAKPRREVDVSRPHRTALALDLNRRIAAMCAEAGVEYVDLDPLSTGPDGEVSPLLVHPDPTDHHYDRVIYSRLLQRALAPVLGYPLVPGADSAEGEDVG